VFYSILMNLRTQI